VNNRLAELRAAKGWTQADLARELDVSRQTVISLEKGRYDPSLPLAFKIAGLFDCTIEDVFVPNGNR
jgi:putative transcriptional regulator